jgi:hypothetical protein
MPAASPEAVAADLNPDKQHATSMCIDYGPNQEIFKDPSNG